MKKFCFVLLDSLNRAPYIVKYLNASKFNYDIVLWDRGRNSDSCGADSCFYLKTGKQMHGILGQLQKALAYVKFAFFASDKLRKNNYDGVFVFTANTAMLCSNILRKKYKGKYILDIRDYWKEYEKWFYNIEKKLVDDCYAAVISSRAYSSFLPKHEYFVSHNSQIITEAEKKHFRSRNLQHKRIVLACIGGIKYADYDKNVIRYFANDPRFELHYVGRGYEILQKYCDESAIYNVVIEGEFPINETMLKYDNVDMILNMYGNHNPKLDYALSNKLYFSAQLAMPILVCPDTYMAEVVEENGLGMKIDINDCTDKDRLWDFYTSLDRTSYIQKCDVFMKKTEEDEEKFRSLVAAFTQESQ